MNQSEMYEHIRAQMRQGVEALEALSVTLKLAGSEMMPFTKGENHLYIRCDSMPWHSVETVSFLATSNFLTLRIVSFNSSPYLNIYK